jgi:hypothetical protein
MHRGMILHESDRTVVIITWQSSNAKTGDMAQIISLVKDVNPITAARTGQDKAVCFDCIHKPTNKGSCYVVLAHSPNQIYKAYQRGNYAPFDKAELIHKLRYTHVRFGSYGEPTLLPLQLMAIISTACIGYTGYTHLWRSLDLQPYSQYLMASVNSQEDAESAMNLGWRYYRVLKTDEVHDPEKEVQCPNYTHGTPCLQCLLCNGAAKGKNIFTYVHGSGHKIVKFNQ